MLSNIMDVVPTAEFAADPARVKTFKLPTSVATRTELMGLPLHNLHRDVIVNQIVAAARANRRMLVVNANAQMIVLAQRLPWIRDLFTKADIAFCDGAGVQLAHRFLKGTGIHRTTPPEWIGPVLKSLGPNASIFWIGGKADVVATAARRYEAEFGVRTAGIQHGYFELSAGSEDNRLLLERINAAKPSIILVNMGMPRQERWIAHHLSQIETGVVISAGALVDHAAGIVSRPPCFVANMGLEWAVRLAREPRRLWRRYLLGLPLFGFYILGAFLNGRKNAV
jgi:N-acetylglucosaminyldiphosphoundecaprenol N-acetyl-beta-D-mannosaminyltransferase